MQSKPSWHLQLVLTWQKMEGDTPTQLSEKELKDIGNKHFAAGKHAEALEWYWPSFSLFISRYTKAIDRSVENNNTADLHVLYSNRYLTRLQANCLEYHVTCNSINPTRPLKTLRK